MEIKGVCIKYPDNNISTDLIFPGKYMAILEPEEMAKHAMEGLDPNFVEKAKGKDVVLVVGRNFGCGSSREQAVTALKHSGVKAILAESFARIYFRNAINEGIAAIEISGITEKIDENDELIIELDRGIVRNLTKGTEIQFKPLPEFMLDIIRSGGLIEYVKKKISSGQ